jgi:hypothetical protein
MRQKNNCVRKGDSRILFSSGLILFLADAVYFSGGRSCSYGGCFVALANRIAFLADAVVFFLLRM